MFELPKLDYDYDSLEPHFSKEMLEVHHKNHHRTYVNKLNGVMESLPDLQGKTVEYIISNLNEIPAEYRTAIKNFGGGHYNHSLFWKFISPIGGELKGDLLNDIISSYGSFADFKADFTKKALGVFGSGWLWLMPDLSIIATANQDTPMNDGLPAPILGIDLWEHAYYIDYRYDRAAYIDAWWNIVNWSEVMGRYKA